MYHIANKFTNLNIEYDDLIGCGDLAFTKALKNFSPAKCKWATYFSHIMTNEILIINRKKSKELKFLSLETVIREDNDSNTLTIQEIVPSREDVTEKVVNLLTVNEILKDITILPPMKSEIFKLYLLGVNQKQIGKKLNLSQSYVSRLIKSMSTGFRATYESGA